tara:strand:- start:5211 stop:5618 length:408 start_codon:yes stop_codon:yes gene_type:complete
MLFSTLKKFFKKFFKKSFVYLLISSLITLIAIFYNYFLIDKLNINLNITFLTSLFIFGFMSYALNAKYNFDQTITFKNYIIFIQNLVVSLIITLIVGNLFNYFTSVSNFYLVIILTILNAFLNFVLNLKYTFKYF